MSKPRKPPFPESLQEDSRCGGPQALYAHHSTYSETPKQRRYLFVLARRCHYEAPKQTCCSNQVKSLVKHLRGKIIETALAEPANQE